MQKCMFKKKKIYHLPLAAIRKQRHRSQDLSIDLNRNRSDKKERDKKTRPRSRSHTTLYYYPSCSPRNPRREFAKAGSKVGSGLKERFEDKIKVEKEGNGRGWVGRRSAFPLACLSRT